MGCGSEGTTDATDGKAVCAIRSRLVRPVPAQQAFEQERPGLVEQGAEPVGAVELLEQLGGELALQLLECAVAPDAEPFVVAAELIEACGQLGQGRVAPADAGARPVAPS